MLTIRSWAGTPAVVRRFARRIRRAGPGALAGREPATHVQIAVFPSTADRNASAPSEATRASIERARRELASIDVTMHRPPVNRLRADPGVLWVFVLDGAELEPEALSILVDVFDHNPELEMAYGDAAARPALDSDGEADLDGHGGTDGPWLLPGFSPDRLADQFYLGHLVAFRPRHLSSRIDGNERITVNGANCRPSTSLSDAGGRQNPPGAIDGPWAPAAAARTVAHVPRPLYRPAPGTGIWQSGGSGRGERRSIPDVPDGDLPPVSVIIPTNGSIRQLERGPVRLVEQAVRSVLGSRYPRLEIVVVLTPGSADDLAPRLHDIVGGHRGGGRTLTVVADGRVFNFSNACNRGALHSAGETLVFLNDDTEVIAHDWLRHLVRHAAKPEVGAVGARLLYEDGRVQHSGIWSRGGHPTHRYEGWPGDATGYRQALAVAQNCLAVTGACLAVERSKFELVGGFSPVFPNSYNDVDLCLKLWDRGLRTVIEPRAELRHFEASTRDPSITDDDLTALHDRWRWRLNHDPFDNPNHTAERSEEWPLPAVPHDLAGADGLQPRLWPLDPVGLVNAG